MEVFQWAAILKYAGPVAAIVVFFLWKDWQRELHTRKRMAVLEKYQRETLEKLVEKSTSALTQSSECIKYLGHIVERLTRICPKLGGGECEFIEKPDALKK